MTNARQGMGRPRNSEIDEAVRAAARELLAEVGYAGVTMDGTAARAGTSKTAIYRRYQSKAELLFAAAVHGSSSSPPDTGSLHGDLLALGKGIRTVMSSPAAREVAPQVIAEIARSPEIARRLREVFVSAELEDISTILTRAVERGELAGHPDITATHRLLGGALFFAIFVVDEVPDDRELEEIVELLACGLVGSSDPESRN